MCVQERNHFAPTRARLRMKNFFFLVQFQMIERKHIENNATSNDRVTTHAMPRARHRDFEMIRPGETQQLNELPFSVIRIGWNFPDFNDGNFVELAGIVNGSFGAFDWFVNVVADGPEKMESGASDSGEKNSSAHDQDSEDNFSPEFSIHAAIIL